jgi:DNA-directed RNA polymerase subunit RPC12/RpoP
MYGTLPSLANDIEQEIECPHCYDVMTLSTNFDSLGYVCQECDFLLVMK